MGGGNGPVLEHEIGRIRDGEPNVKDFNDVDVKRDM